MQRTLVFDSLWDNELRGYLFKALLLRRPRATFERYCDLLRDTLELVRDISGFRWQE